MALFTFLPEASETQKQPSKRRKKQQKQKQPSSWDQFKNLLSCRQIENSIIHDPSKNPTAAVYYSKLGSCSSICSFNDDVLHHGNNTRVVHRADDNNNNSLEDQSSSNLGQESRLLSKKTSHGSSSSRSFGSSTRSNASTTSRGMQLRKLSGCYECHMIVDPSRYPVPRSNIYSCPECGEVFPKIESLEHHQAVRHAVSELGPEDSSRNIVEIIFKSSWLKKDNPICKIERILKVHNTKRAIHKFEDYRDAVKLRATVNGKKNPRCAADGNELLRFYCTTLTCSLGAKGTSNLCSSVCTPGCGVCTIIRHGFQGNNNKVCGVRTTASSGRAHDCLDGGDGGRRAMLVCRVIAGRVKRVAENAAAAATEDESGDSGLSAAGNFYDSVVGYSDIYSNLEELYVFNSRAILPCFVVIYKALES